MSKLNFKDPAESALVNSKFVGRTVDDSMTGKIDLNNVAPESGDAITNMQRQINENKSALLGDQTLINGDSLLADSISKQQVKRVIGDSAAIIVNSLPFGATPDIQDGTIIYIIGKDDTNTVTIEHNDINDGCLLNGDATLLRGYCIQLFWDAGARRFIDIGRNF
jgi:hypothetical protein